MDQNRMFTHRVFRNFVLGGSATQMEELLDGVFANSMVADMWRDLDDVRDEPDLDPARLIASRSHAPEVVPTVDYLGASDGTSGYAVIMPPPTSRTAAYFVFVLTSPALRYFTVEYSPELGSVDDPTGFLCEWTTTLEHRNHGRTSARDATCGFVRVIGLLDREKEDSPNRP